MTNESTPLTHPTVADWLDSIRDEVERIRRNVRAHLDTQADELVGPLREIDEKLAQLGDAIDDGAI